MILRQFMDKICSDKYLLNKKGVSMRLVLIIFAFYLSRQANAQVEHSKCFIGTSAFMLANLDQNTTEPPHFYQLNFGYQLTEQDVISVEAITWQYYAPLGAPLSIADADKFPGSVKGRGIGIAYQRFLWRGLYGAVHGTWFDQQYIDNNGNELGKGSQLFLALRLGYRISFLGDTLFMEPSIAVTHWPVNDGLPATFQAREDKWPQFQVEPGLHVGFLF